MPETEIMDTLLTITPSAKNRITDILSTESTDTKLRIFVQGGGCAGFSYGFTLDSVVAEDDFQITNNDITVLVDSSSLQYLNGSVLDYKEDLMNCNFTIDNPNANTTCGCGSSFNPF